MKAEVAKRDPPDVRLEIWNEISNYKDEELREDNANNSSNNTTITDEDEEKDESLDARGSEDDDSPDARDVEDDDSPDARGMEDKEVLHCNLCFYDGKPVKIVSSYNEGCPTCPMMTPAQKVDMIGPLWKDQAEMIFKMKYKEKQQRRRRYART